MNLKVLQRDEYLEITRNTEFISDWQELANKSQEFTLIQEPDLVISWYEAYKSQYDPLLVIAYSKSIKKIIGILPLAVSLKTDELSHAGDEQAEYNGWVCEKEYEEEFLINSLVLLRDKLKLNQWNWGWIPPNANTNWLFSKKLEENGISVNIGTSELPIYDLSDQERIDKIKKSKSTKSKINRLKRTGELRIERITDLAKAEQVFVDLKKISNFRNMAVYDNMPFSNNDSNKEKWHLNHLDGSDSVHFTVLWQGDEFLACNFGFCSDDTVIIGLFTYNPVQGAHSPGNVFLIELIDFIKKEGFQYLDLSPGGDPYKERFSNTHIALTKPVFCFNSRCKFKTKVITYLKNKIKEKYSYRDLINIKSKIKRKFSGITNGHKKSEVFRFSPEDSNDDHVKFNLQRYDDLLLYKEEKGCKKHNEVIFSSLKNFERGDLLYTLVEDERLVFSAWVSLSGKKHWDKELDEFTSITANNILVYDIHFGKNNSSSKLLNEFASMLYSTYVVSNEPRDLYLVEPNALNNKQLTETGFSLTNLS